MSEHTQPPVRLTLPPRNRGWWHSTKLALGILMFAAMLVALAMYTAPDLVTDWQIHDAARPVPGGQVVKGSCSSNLVFNICDATLAVTTPSGRVERSVNFIFTDVHFGDYSVGVVADPAHPGLPTTDMALDKLWNRTVTLLVGTVVLLAFVILPTAAVIKRRRRIPA